jgi:cytochrome P450
MNTEKRYTLYGPQFKADPFPTYALMREQEPICYHPGITGEGKIWFITRYEDVQAVLRDHRRFVKNWRNTRTPEELAQLQPESELDRLLSRHMLNSDGGDHARQRALVNKAFSSRMIAAQQGRVQAIADELIDGVERRGSMDLIDEYAFPLPIVVIAEMLGIPSKDRDRFRLWSNAFVTPHLTEEEWQAAAVLLREFVGYLRLLLEERRLAPKDDLITALLQAEEAGDKLSEEELFSMIILLITAGHETTVNLIGNAMLALLQHPQQMAQLKGNPALIGPAIEEFLRYDGPVDRATTRFAAEDIDFRGHLIERGQAVIPVLGSANRDERIFAEADTLDITRQNNKHLGFGFGVHYCVGAPLARMEGSIAVNTLLQRLPNLRLAVPVEDLAWTTIPLFHGMRHMPVMWGERTADG